MKGGRTEFFKRSYNYSLHMPQFKCLACGEILTAPTREELMELVRNHAKEAHGLEMNPIIEAMVKRLIRD